MASSKIWKRAYVYGSKRGTAMVVSGVMVREKAVQLYNHSAVSGGLETGGCLENCLKSKNLPLKVPPVLNNVPGHLRILVLSIQISKLIISPSRLPHLCRCPMRE
jgi:hypothetical protein